MSETATQQRPSTLAATINQTLADVMAADQSIVLMGEDIGQLGGVFRVTSGLQERFGADRVRNSLLAEAGIVGQAIGMSIAGMHPICEIQFDGFTYPATNQMISQAPRIADRWQGLASANIVLRIPSGAGTRSVEHHSESNETLFARVPGIRVGYPSTGEDYAQMLRYSLEAGGPTVLYEPIRLYHRSRTEAREAVDAANPTSAVVIRPGSGVTVACYGAITQEVLKASREAADLDPEVIDLRWVNPLDTETVLASVRKTGRLLIVHEAGLNFGIGAELAAQVAETAWDCLKAPVRRLAPESINYPPANHTDGYHVTTERIIDALKEITK